MGLLGAKWRETDTFDTSLFLDFCREQFSHWSELRKLSPKGWYLYARILQVQALVVMRTNGLLHAPRISIMSNLRLSCSENVIATSPTWRLFCALCRHELEPITAEHTARNGVNCAALVALPKIGWFEYKVTTAFTIEPSQSRWSYMDMVSCGCLKYERQMELRTKKLAEMRAA